MDCYYHGYTAGAACPDCDANTRAGRDAGDNGPIQPRPQGPTPPSYRKRSGPLAVEKGKDYALAQLKLRKEENQNIRRPDNSEFYAGSPMYFYCSTCGDLSDIKAENYDPRTSPINHMCEECDALKEKGWLPES